MKRMYQSFAIGYTALFIAAVVECLYFLRVAVTLIGAEPWWRPYATLAFALLASSLARGVYIQAIRCWRLSRNYPSHRGVR